MISGLGKPLRIKLFLIRARKCYGRPIARLSIISLMSIIATLPREGASGDLSVIVKNEAHEPVLFIPGLPGCA